MKTTTVKISTYIIMRAVTSLACYVTHTFNEANKPKINNNQKEENLLKFYLFPNATAAGEALNNKSDKTMCTHTSRVTK